eukprot:gene1229-11319_t
MSTGFLPDSQGFISLLNSNFAAKYTNKNDQTPVTVFENFVMQSGVHYAEFTIVNSSNPSKIMLGISDKLELKQTKSYLSDSLYGWGYKGDGNVSGNYSTKIYSSGFNQGDVIGVLADFSIGKLDFFKNGMELGTAYTGISGPVSFALTLFSNSDEVSMKSGLPIPKVINDFITNPNLTMSKNNLVIKKNQYQQRGAETFFTKQTLSTGVHYFEVKILNTVNLSNIMIGISDPTVLTNKKSFLSHCAYGWGYYSDGNTYHQSVAKMYSKQFGVNDVIGVYTDLFAQNVSFFLNGEYLGVAYTSVSPPFSFAVTLFDLIDEVEINPNAIIPQIPQNVSLPQTSVSKNWLFQPTPGVSISMATMKSQLDGQPRTVISNQSFSSGRIYFEIIIYGTGNPSLLEIGFVDSSISTNLYLSSSKNGYGLYGNGGVRNNSQFYTYAGNIKFKVNDKIGACVDMDKKTIEYYYNGSNLGVAFSNVDTSVPLSPAITFFNLADDLDYFPQATEPNLGTSIATISSSPISTSKNQGTSKFNFSPAVGIILSNNNLTAKFGELSNNQIRTVFSKNMWSTGIHYWEIKIVNTSIPSNIMIGVADSGFLTDTKTFLSHCSYGWGYYGYNGDKFHNKLSNPYGSSYKAGDVIGVSLNLTTTSIEFFLNGISQGIAYTNVSGPVDCAVTLYDLNDEVILNSNAVIPTNQGSNVGIGTTISQPLIGNSFSFKPIPGVSLSNGNLTAKYAETMNNQLTTVFATNSLSQGYHYWEVQIVKTTSPSSIMVGICDPVYLQNPKTYLSHSSYGWGYGLSGTSSFNSVSKPYGQPIKTGDIIGVSADFAKKTLEFFLNGTSQGVCYSGISGPVSPAVTLYDFSDEVVLNCLAKPPTSVGTSVSLSFAQGYLGILLSNNNLTAKLGEPSDCIRTVSLSQVYTTGKHYCEFKINNTTNPSNIMVGIFDSSLSTSTSMYLSHTSYGMGYKGDGTYVLQSKQTNTTRPKFSIGDTIGVLLDLVAQTVVFYHNNTNLGAAFTKVSGPVSFGVTLSSILDEISINPNAVQPNTTSTSLGDNNLKKTDDHFNLFTSVQGLILSKNNLNLKNTNYPGYKTVFGTSEWTVNRHYWEVRIVNTKSPSNIMIGVSDKSVLTNINSQLSDSQYGWGLTADGKLYSNSIFTKNYGKGFKKDDRIGVFLDLEEKTLQFFHNRRCLGIAYSGVTGPVSCAVTLYDTNDEIEIDTYAKLPLDHGFVEDAPGINVSENLLTAKLIQKNPQIIYSQPITRRGRSYFQIKINEMKTQMGIGLADKVVYSSSQNIKDFRFENLTMFSPLVVENGKMIIQKQNATNSVISKVPMKQGVLSYFEFKVLRCEGNDMIIVGLAPQFKEITPTGSRQHPQYNWVGCGKGEYSFSRDGQYFVDGETKVEFKSSQDKIFETNDIVGISLTEGAINFFKNGVLSNTIEIPFSTLPFYPAITLFGENTSVEVQDVDLSKFEEKNISSHLWLYNSSATISKERDIQKFGVEFKKNDIVGLTYDCDVGTVDFFVNGKHMGQPFGDLPEINPMLAIYLYDEKDEIELSLESSEPSYIKSFINQWVMKVPNYSSDEATFPHTNLIGPSNTYPKYGDHSTTWSPKTEKGTKEFLELEYEEDVFPLNVNVYETYNVGCCVKISGKNNQGNWVTFWEGFAETDPQPKARIFSPPLKNNNFKTRHIRLDIDCMKTKSYYEVDAVLLVGKLPPQEFQKREGLTFSNNNRTISLKQKEILSSNVAMDYQTGKHYCSIKIEKCKNKIIIGAIQSTVNFNDKKPLDQITTGYSFHSNGNIGNDIPYGIGFKEGDEIGLLFDSDNQSLEFFVNDVSQGVAFKNVKYPISGCVTLFDEEDTVTLDPLATIPTFDTMKFVSSNQSAVHDNVINSGNDSSVNVYGNYVLNESEVSYFWDVKILKSKLSKISVGVITPNETDFSKASIINGDGTVIIEGNAKSAPFTFMEGDVVSVSVNFIKKEIEFLVNGKKKELLFSISEKRLIPFISLNEQDAEVSIDLNALDPFSLTFYTDDQIKLAEGVELANKNKTARKNNKLKGPVSIFGSKLYEKGRHYFSVTIDKDAGSSNDMMVGVANPVFQKNNQFLSHGPSGWAYYGWGSAYHNSKAATYAQRYTKGDKIGVIFDLDKFTIEFFKNGVYLGIASTSVYGPVRASVSLYGPEDSITINEYELEPKIPKGIILAQCDSVLLTNNYLTAKKTSVKSPQTIVSTEFMTKGKHFASFKIEKAMIPMEIMFGVMDPFVNNNAQTWLSHGTKGWAFYCYNGSIYHNKNQLTFQNAPQIGDEIGVSIDLDQNIMDLYKNNEYLGTAYTGVTGPLKFAVTLYNEGDTISFIPNKTEPKQSFIDNVGPFEHGKKLCLRSFWGTYASYGSNYSPTIVNETNKDCVFTVELSKNKFTFKDSRKLKLTAETGNTEFKIVALKDPDVNGYTFQSKSGKYLGISSDMTLKIYNDSKSQNTKWFPEEPSSKLLGVGPFYKDSKLVVKTSDSKYIEFKNDEISLSTKVTPFCYVKIEQIDDGKFKFIDSTGNLIKFLNYDEISIKELDVSYEKGFTFQIKNEKFISIDKNGKINFVQSSLNLETRFYPFYPKKAVGPFKDGAVISLRTHLEKYFFYNTTMQPDVKDEIDSETKFTVHQFCDQFLLTGSNNLHVVCTTSADKLFKVIENDTEIKSYSLLFNSGKYLGVSTKSRVLVYSNTDSSDTKWYPVADHIKLDPFKCAGGCEPIVPKELMKWESNIQIDSLINPIHEISKHSQVLYQTKDDNILYLIGGKISENTFSKNLISFNLETNEIEIIIPKNPIQLIGHVSFSYLDSIYTFGGMNEKGELNNSIYQFNFETKEWKELDYNGIPPSKRSNSSISMIKSNKFCLFGGKDYDNYFNDLYTFDIKKLKWNKIEINNTLKQDDNDDDENIPSERFGSSLIFNSKKNTIFLFGGFDKENEYLNDLHEFDFKTLEWKLTEDDGDLPEKRIGQSVCKFGDLLYLSNGFDGEIYFQDLYEFNMETSIWTLIFDSSEIKERANHSLIYFDGNLILFGGDNEKNYFKDINFLKLEDEIIEKYEDDLEFAIEDEDTENDWSKIKSKQSIGRSFHSTFMRDNSIYLFGGLHEKNSAIVPNQEMLIFDFESLDWTKVKQNKARQQPEARKNQSCILFKDEIFVFGGKGKQVYSKVHVFDLKTQSWSIPKVTGTISSRTNQCCCLFDTNKIAVFGGIDKGDQSLNDLHYFDIEKLTWNEIKNDDKSPNSRSLCTLESFTNESNESVLCLFGGIDENSKALNDVFEFNFTKNEWKLIEKNGDKISPRFGHSSISNEKEMFIFGGFDGNEYFDQLFNYNFETKLFTQIDKTLNQPMARIGSTLLLKDDSLILYGGENETIKLIDIIESFQLLKK